MSLSLGKRQELFSRYLAQLITEAIRRGYGVRMGEVQRPVEMQSLYVKTGRSKTMDSLHLEKCAADLHFTLNGEICYPRELGSYWESLDVNCSWGGNWKSFKDEPHFELRKGK